MITKERISTLYQSDERDLTPKDLYTLKMANTIPFTPPQAKSPYHPRILFVGEGTTAAHILRPLKLAETLIEDYDIHFACPAAYHPTIPSKIHAHVLESVSRQTFLERLDRGSTFYTQSELERYVQDELLLLKRINPDVVIGDFRLSLGISSRVLNIPYACLLNAHWSPYSTQSFPVPDVPIVRIMSLPVTKALFAVAGPLFLNPFIQPFNQVCKSYGLPPARSIQEMHTSADEVVYLDIPELAPTADLPENHHYVGPIDCTPSISLPSWWRDLPKDKDLVYISSGSSGNTDVIQSICEAVLASGKAAMVATAGRITAETLPKEAYCTDYIPGDMAARRASTVICNGGSAAVYQALSAGTPVIGIPANADQYFSMTSVEALGVGEMIRSSQVTQKRVMKTLRRMNGQDSYKKEASAIQARIQATPTAMNFRILVESIFRSIADRKEHRYVHAI